MAYIIFAVFGLPKYLVDHLQSMPAATTSRACRHVVTRARHRPAVCIGTASFRED